MPSYNPAMQKASFTDDAVEVVSAGRVSKRIAKLDGLRVTSKSLDALLAGH